MLNAGLLLAALFLTTSIAMAQPQGRHHGPKGTPFKAIEALEEELSLTPAQKEAIEALREKTKSAHKEMRREGRAAREGHVERRSALHESLKNELDAILTPEQTQLLVAHRKAKVAEHRAAHEKMRKAMEAYHDENVKPILLQQRQKLEAKISKEDKAIIAKIRAERQELHQNKSKGRDRARSLGEEAKPRPNREEVAALVEKYSADIESLMKEIEPQREQWKKDMKAIAEANRPEGNGRIGKARRLPKHNFQKAHFLLMDTAM